MGTISNGCNRSIAVQTGTIPDVSGGLKDTFQNLTFEPVTKMTSAFQVIETGAPVSFWGCIQPFKDRELLIKPEGQRAWTWFWLFAEPSVTLNVDDVMMFLYVPYSGPLQPPIAKQTRVMARKDYTLYGYVMYACVQDWTGAGPST